MSHHQDKRLSLLGLAFRARKLLSGEEMVINAIKNKQVHLVILAEDASSRTTKTLTDKCEFYKVPYLQHFNRQELGNAIGKEARVTIGITDKGFSERMMALTD